MKLFGRRVKLEVGPSGGVGFAWDQQIRIDFEVEKNDGGTPDTAKIQVYNLSKESRDLIEQKGVICRLFAGWDASEITPLLFFGDVNDCISEKRGNDWVTEISAKDGGRAVWRSKICKTYGKGVDSTALIRAVANDAGIMVRIPSGFPSYRFGGAVVIDGSPSGVFDVVCKSLGVKWCIQDGEAVFSIPGAAATLDEVAIVTPISGLIGFPKKMEKGVGYSIKTLLMPQIKPRKQIALSDGNINQTLVVKSVRHYGSSGWENEYCSDIEAVDPLKEKTATSKKTNLPGSGTMVAHDEYEADI